MFKLIFSTIKSGENSFSNCPPLSHLFQKNFFQIIKQKVNQLHSFNSTIDLHYLLISSAYLVNYWEKFELILLLQEIKSSKEKEQCALLLKHFYLVIFQKQEVILRLLKYNYLLMANLFSEMDCPKNFKTEKIESKFDFFQSQTKISIQENEGVLNSELKSPLGRKALKFRPHRVLSSNRKSRCLPAKPLGHFGHDGEVLDEVFDCPNRQTSACLPKPTHAESFGGVWESQEGKRLILL